MVEDNSLFPAASAMGEAVAFVGGGDGTMVMDHEVVFVSHPGDSIELNLTYILGQR